MNAHSDVSTPKRVYFQSNGERCVADFYRPVGNGPFPIMVMAHGLGGTRNMRLPAFAQKFVDAGYACLVFDYRHFGESEGQPRQLIDIDRQLDDWKAALAHARQMRDVAPDKVIIWGTSFGGGHVLTIAANDKNLAAVISQCPFTDGLASTMAVSPLVSLRLTLLALMDRIGSWFGAKPLLIPLAGHPGTTAFMTAPDALDGYQALVPPGTSIRNEAAARFALEIVRYYPGRKTSAIAAPVMFCVCEPDSVAPSKQTLKHASRTPSHEVKRYSYGHFDIYIGQAFEHVVKDQLEFLLRTVPTNQTNRRQA